MSKMWSLKAQSSKNQRVCPNVPHIQWQKRIITVTNTPIQKRSQSQKSKHCIIPLTLIPSVVTFIETGSTQFHRVTFIETRKEWGKGRMGRVNEDNFS